MSGQIVLTVFYLEPKCDLDQGSCDKRGARKVHSASICCELKSWNCLLALLLGTVLRKQVKTVKNDARTAEIQFKTRQDTSEGADFCKHTK